MPSIENPYSEILRLRKAQIAVNKAVGEKRFKVPVHLALGHEAIAVSVASTMGSEDYIVLTHRNIHYHLALGATQEQLIDEYSLLPTGLAGGRLGSMNLVNICKRNIYTSNILANSLAVSLGVAQAAKIKSRGQVTWVTTGDGAMEEGAFYETILCATSWNLPLIVIVENNKWSLGTEIDERRVQIDAKKLSSSLQAEYISLKGNKLEEYLPLLQKARLLAATGKPTVVEVIVETLGGYFIHESDGSRYINYHAGSARLQNDSIIISHDFTDPLFANQKNLSEDLN